MYEKAFFVVVFCRKQTLPIFFPREQATPGVNKKNVTVLKATDGLLRHYIHHSLFETSWLFCSSQLLLLIR